MYILQRVMIFFFLAFTTFQSIVVSTKKLFHSFKWRSSLQIKILNYNQYLNEWVEIRLWGQYVALHIISHLCYNWGFFTFFLSIGFNCIILLLWVVWYFPSTCRRQRRRSTKFVIGVEICETTPLYSSFLKVVNSWGCVRENHSCRRLHPFFIWLRR